MMLRMCFTDKNRFFDIAKYRKEEAVSYYFLMKSFLKLFIARLEGYEAHQLTCIETAQKFCPFTARRLPTGQISLLDLGCG